MANTHVNTMQQDYRVERLDRGRLAHLEILHKAVYSAAPRKNYFVEKYNTAYTGADYIGYIAYNADNFPIAYYGVMPCLMQYNNVTFLAAQSGDTMTHPDFRYKGLFVELANRTFDLCRDNGIWLIYGFPNQNSRHGLLEKLGWVSYENLDRFSIPVTSLPIAKIIRRFNRSKQVYENFCRRVLRKYLLSCDGLPNAAMHEDFGGVERDDRFLKYKRYSPSYVIGIAGGRVWFSIRQQLMIGDMEVEENQFSGVMNELKKMAQRLGLPEINFQVSPGTRLHKLFAANYTPSASFPVCFKNLGADVPLEKIKFSFADIDIF